MKKFDLGDKVLNLRVLEFCTNPYHYKVAAEFSTVKSANEDHFSIHQIDLNESLPEDQLYKKCNQHNGRSHGPSRDQYLNITKEPELVVSTVDDYFRKFEVNQKAKAERRIQELRTHIKVTEAEIKSLESEPVDYEFLKKARAYILKNLGVESSKARR
jgi:hypothetical protein